MSSSDVKFELWEKISLNSKNIETKLNPLERKRTGSYFTDLELTDVMMTELIEYILMSRKDIWNLRFLEPCVGTGNFIFSYLKIISNMDLQKEQVNILLDNIYVADINKEALEEYKIMLCEFVRIYFDIELSEKYFDNHMGSGLLIDVTSEKLEYIPITKVFPLEVVKNGFDIVVTNPPYKNLKAERGHYSNLSDYEIDKEKYFAISEIVKNKFKFSTKGVLNLYKIFIEEIIDTYASKDAYVNLLVPASIMSDKTCEKLRTHMLLDSAWKSIKLINEGSGYVDAQQALCAILIKKGEKTDYINIVKNFCDSPNETVNVKIEDILNKNNGNSIFAINKEEYAILCKLKKFPIVKELNFITNLRGELDLTSNKQYITNEKTEHSLLRGRNIGFYELLDTGEYDFVENKFLEVSKKSCYIYNDRIVCQQIANMHKERRITFSYVEANKVLGNSCNFIAVSQNEYGIDIFSLLGLFNSSFINWLFKLTSSNNHINNYEIDCFPVPVNAKELAKISELVRQYLKQKEPEILEEIEECVLLAYGLKEKKLEEDIVIKYMNDINYLIPKITKELAYSILNGELDIISITKEKGISLSKMKKEILLGITNKYSKLFYGEILNHTTFKLSDLDLEMIKNIPPGGSWKDIPIETVEKSKRLKRIKQTGGRTTLYGRIDYNKPSYTITTYFNRPGNGTYVHPSHERVLSVREAARFQCFRDDYYFYGNKSQILNQVGNAVPTIMAYQIGKAIVEKTDCRKSVDLFCGAGGMTVGFKAAGIQSLISNDIEESACITLKINNPEINVLCGDITLEETKKKIIDTALRNEVDIICGGPPCQGFSMAGLRLTDDPRNQLFKEFIDVVKRINPKVVVFENVEGILSFQKGKVYETILRLFSEIGYKTEGRILMATHYAVPQKRKRVIIICVRNDLPISPFELFPIAITENPECQITAKETIGDLDCVLCDEHAKYVEQKIESDILQFFKNKISYEEYVNRNSYFS